MGLFQRKRFVWNEPWFFQQRIRRAKAWLLFSLLLLAVASACGAALYFSAPAGRPISLLEVVGLSVGLAAAIWWVLDGANLRRRAVLYEDAISVGGDMGKYSMATTYKLSKISGAAIVMPAESKYPAPILFFYYEGGEEFIGIEPQASLPRLAQAIRDVGIPLRFDGWRPDQVREFQKAFHWQADPASVVEQARMEVLPPGTVSIMSVGGILLALFRQSWAIVLWLLVTGAAVYYGFQNWRSLGLVQWALLFVVPLGAMYIAGQYTDRFAGASTTQGLTRMARKQFRKRVGISLDPDSPDLLPVEVFARDQFEKTIQRNREVGFLQADLPGERMLYEGKKERWCIPARSIRSVTLEEVQVGTPGQSALGALTYYVVVRFAAAEDQELGFRCGDRDFGEYGDIQRAEGGIRVYEAFESILPRS